MCAARPENEQATRERVILQLLPTLLGKRVDAFSAVHRLNCD